TEAQRNDNEIELILRYQFERAFWGMEAEVFSRCVLAYEPVWAIGTGNTATPEVAEGAHRFLRRCARDIFGPEAAQALTILYGGSIKPSNMRALLDQPDVDGGLVGTPASNPIRSPPSSKPPTSNEGRVGALLRTLEIIDWRGTALGCPPIDPLTRRAAGDARAACCTAGPGLRGRLRVDIYLAK